MWRWLLIPLLLIYDPYYGKVEWLDDVIDWMED